MRMHIFFNFTIDAVLRAFLYHTHAEYGIPATCIVEVDAHTIIVCFIFMA